MKQDCLSRYLKSYPNNADILSVNRAQHSYHIQQSLTELKGDKRERGQRNTESTRGRKFYFLNVFI